MSTPFFIKLLRNRITFFALPIILLYLAGTFFAISVLNIDFNTFLNFLFIALLLFLFALLFWRRISPLSFWSFYIFTEPYNARFYSNRATAYLRRADYEHALADCNTGFQLQPREKIRAALYNQHSVIFVHMGKYEEALQNAECGLHCRTTKLVSAALLYNRGNTYGALFAYDAALRDYEQVIRTSRLFAPIAHLSRGLIYAAQGNYQLALQEEDLSIQKRPMYLNYAMRAAIHLKYCQYQPALDDANRALRRCRPTYRLMTRRGGDYPYAASVYALRALAYCGLANYQVALEDARRAAALAPVYGQSFYSLGQVYLMTNDFMQARQTFQQGCAADPKNVSNAALLAWTQMCMTPPNVEQAAFLDEAANNYPQSEWGQLCRGIAAWLHGDYANARTHLARAQQLDVTNPHSYFWLGMLHASLEEDDLARSALHRALQSGLARVLFMPLLDFEQKRPGFFQSVRFLLVQR
jgi:tetratricopeptide (TPR) repeat protein